MNIDRHCTYMKSRKISSQLLIVYTTIIDFYIEKGSIAMYYFFIFSFWNDQTAYSCNSR